MHSYSESDVIQRRIFLCRPSKAVSFGLTIRRYRADPSNQSQYENRLPASTKKHYFHDSSVTSKSAYETRKDGSLYLLRIPPEVDCLPDNNEHSSVVYQKYKEWQPISRINDGQVDCTNCQGSFVVRGFRTVKNRLPQAHYGDSQYADGVVTVRKQRYLRNLTNEYYTYREPNRTFIHKSGFSVPVRMNIKAGGTAYCHPLPAGLESRLGVRKDFDKYFILDTRNRPKRNVSLKPKGHSECLPRQTTDVFRTNNQCDVSLNDSLYCNVGIAGARVNEIANTSRHGKSSSYSKQKHSEYTMTIGLCASPPAKSSMFLHPPSPSPIFARSGFDRTPSPSIGDSCSASTFPAEIASTASSPCQFETSCSFFSKQTTKTMQAVNECFREMSSHNREDVTTRVQQAHVGDHRHKCCSNATHQRQQVIIKEGFIHCKTVVVSHRKATDRSWHNVYAILHRSGDLFLCKDNKQLNMRFIPSVAGSRLMQTTRQQLVSPLDTITDRGTNSSKCPRQALTPLTNVPFPLSMCGDQGAMVQLAVDYKKKQRVFRLSSFKQGTELLMHTADLQSFCEWLYELRKLCWRNSSAGPSSAEAGTENSMSVGTAILHKSSTRPLEKNPTTSKVTLNVKTYHQMNSSQRPRESKLSYHDNRMKSENRMNSELKQCIEATRRPFLLSSSSSDSAHPQTLTSYQSAYSKRKFSSSPLVRRGMAGCLRRGILSLSNHHNEGGDFDANKPGQSSSVSSTMHSTSRCTSLNEQESEPGNFGIPLSQCAQSTIYPNVPLIVVVLSKLIEAFGLRNVGVYRQTGSVQTTSWMIDQLNFTPIQSIDFKDIRWQDMKAIASTLKTFLSRLPECLFGQDSYMKLLDCAQISNKDIVRAQVLGLIESMDSSMQATLSYLLQHFEAITSMSAHNKVDVKNIAIIFGPTLVWHPGRALEESLADNPEKVRLLETLLQNPDVFIEKWGVWNDGMAKRERFQTSFKQRDFSTATPHDVTQLIFQLERE